MLVSVVVYDNEDVAQAARVFEGGDTREALMNMLEEVRPSAHSIYLDGNFSVDAILNDIIEYLDELWVTAASNEQHLIENWGNACTDEPTINMLSMALDRHLDEALLDEL